MLQNLESLYDFYRRLSELGTEALRIISWSSFNDPNTSEHPRHSYFGATYFSSKDTISQFLQLIQIFGDALSRDIKQAHTDDLPAYEWSLPSHVQALNGHFKFDYSARSCY